MINNNHFALDLVAVTKAAAIAAYGAFGQGDATRADQLAVDSMRSMLNNLNIKGTIVIGEGERDNAPMLYIGEKVGTMQGYECDIALDPLEGTSILANGEYGALSVIAMADNKNLLNAPDVYMEKIAVGINSTEYVIDLDNTPMVNLKNIAKVKKCDISDLVVVILKRNRHEELVAKVREAGAKVKLIQDGDISAVIETTNAFYSADVYMGIGGAPEGVLAAAALSALGGQMCTRLQLNDGKDRAHKMGIKDVSKQYRLTDMVGKNVIFAATGVTKGNLLNGVERFGNMIRTNSILTNTQTKNYSIITDHIIDSATYANSYVQRIPTILS